MNEPSFESEGEPRVTCSTQELSVEQSNKGKRADRPKRQPRYNVILWDDNDHTYDYVAKMMRSLFGFTAAKGYEIATRVDNDGKAVCLTTTMEHAELKRDQIRAFGKDDVLSKSIGSMYSSIEPVPE